MYIFIYVCVTGGMRGAVSMALALSLTLSVEAGLTTVDSGDAHLVRYFALDFPLNFALICSYFWLILDIFPYWRSSRSVTTGKSDYCVALLIY